MVLLAEVDIDAFISRIYGYALAEAELYRTEAEKEQMFVSVDSKMTDVTTMDEWTTLFVEHIIVKTTILANYSVLSNLEVTLT